MGLGPSVDLTRKAHGMTKELAVYSLSEQLKTVHLGGRIEGPALCAGPHIELDSEKIAVCLDPFLESTHRGEGEGWRIRADLKIHGSTLINVAVHDGPTYSGFHRHPFTTWIKAPSKCHALLGILSELKAAGRTQDSTNVHKAISQLKLCDPDYDADWFFVLGNIELNCKTTIYRYKIVVEPFNGVFRASIVLESEDDVGDEKDE